MFVSNFRSLSLGPFSRGLKENYLVICLIWSLVLKSKGVGSKEVSDPMRSLLRHRAASIIWEGRGQSISTLCCLGGMHDLTDRARASNRWQELLVLPLPLACWFQSTALHWLSSPCNCWSLSWSPGCSVWVCLLLLAFCFAVIATGNERSGFLL